MACTHTFQADLEDRADFFEDRIKSATEAELSIILGQCINLYDESVGDCSELDKSIFNYTRDNIQKHESGRIIVSVLWDKQTEHLFASNFKFANKILLSTLKKFKNRPEAFVQYDEVIQEQIREGIVELISD